MCGAFTHDCGYDNSTIDLTGDVFCPNTECSGKLRLQKRLLNLSAEAIINARNARLFSKGAIFLLKILKIKPILFFLIFGKGVYSFEDSPKSVEEVIGDV